MLKLTLCFLRMSFLFFGVVYCHNLSDEILTATQVDKVLVKQDFYHFNNGNSIISHTCTAYGKRGDFLSWYQNKDSKHHLLHRVQRIDNGTGMMQLTLKLTLQESDNNTEIYCARQRELDNGTMSYGTVSLMTPITFLNGVIKLETPYVTITPDTSPRHFVINETLNLVCNGSKLEDGRRLMWFIQADPKPKYAINQTFNNETNISNLDLHLDESYHKKELFCVQAYQEYKTLSNFEFENYFHGEKARSTIKLCLRKKKTDINQNSNETNEDEEESNEDSSEVNCNERRFVNGEYNMERKDGASYLLPLLITLAVLALVSILAVIWLKCRKNNLSTLKTKKPRGNQENEESPYATAQVSYVQLDFKQSSGQYASTRPEERSPYTQIIGVINTKLNRK